MAASEERSESAQRPLTYLKVSVLHVDEEYQNPINPHWARKIAREFDRDLFRPLDVSVRADGSAWVVDGRHRLEALRIMGLDNAVIPCRIYRGLVRAEEARLYYRLNTSVKTKRTAAIFHSRVAAGEPVADEITRICADYGFEVSTQFRGSAPSKIVCVGTLEAIFNTGGASLLKGVLSLLHDTWAGRAKVSDANFVKTVYAFVVIHEDMSRARFVQALSRHEPEALLVEGRAFSRATSHNAVHGYYYVLVQHYNFRLRDSDKLVPITKEQYGQAIREWARRYRNP